MEPWLPLVIFFARIVDVSLGTIRMLFVISGAEAIAAVLGFAEVIVWVVAVGKAIQNLDDPAALIAYAGGFATGTLVGMRIERVLALGFRTVSIVNRSPGERSVCTALHEIGYAVTRIDGSTPHGPVELGYVVLRRRFVRRLLDEVQRIAPGCAVAVERADHAFDMAAAAGRGRQRWFMGIGSGLLRK